MKIGRPIKRPIRRLTARCLVGSPFGFTPEDVPQSEAGPLIYFYNATSGATWPNNAGWLVDPVVDNWTGITVTAENVTALDLLAIGLAPDASHDVFKVSTSGTFVTDGFFVTADNKLFHVAI